MQSNIHTRLSSFIDTRYSGRITDAARDIGISKQRMFLYVRSTTVPHGVLEALCLKNPDLNPTWLLLGKGPMLLTQTIEELVSREVRRVLGQSSQ